MHQCKHTLNLSCVCQRQTQTFYLTAGLCMSKMRTKLCTCVCLKLRLKLRLQKWSCKGLCKDQNRSAKSHLNTQTICCYLYPTKYQYTTKRSFLSHHENVSLLLLRCDCLLNLQSTGLYCQKLSIRMHNLLKKTSVEPPRICFYLSPKK